MVKQLSSVICALTLFISIGFAQDVVLTLDGGNLNYESSADIYGFQFDHAGCATGASSGDATDPDLSSGKRNNRSRFLILGRFCTAGSGTFLAIGVNQLII